MLDEMTQQNTSKFATFYIYENPTLIFPVFISCYFIFPLINAPVDVDIDKGIHKGKSTVARNEKRKNLRGFSYYFSKF